MTFRHWASVGLHMSSQLTLRRPVFLINSSPARFAETPERSGREAHHEREHPFFRSYGANWSSSFNWSHSSALGYDPRLHVSVLVRSPAFVPPRLFSSAGRGPLPLHFFRVATTLNVAPQGRTPDFPEVLVYGRGRAFLSARRLGLLRPPLRF